MKRLALVSLVGANLLVAFQVLRHDWGYYETILIFWCEALIIGAYNVLRLLLVGLFGERPLGETVSRYVEFSPGFRVLATAVGTAFFACKFGMFALGNGRHGDLQRCRERNQPADRRNHLLLRCSSDQRGGPIGVDRAAVDEDQELMERALGGA